METKQFYSLLKQLEIPVAYSNFKTETELPYCVYLESRDVYGDDFKNTIADVQYIVELYDDVRNLELEEKIEKIFDENGFNYSVEYGVYLQDDQTFMTTYTIESIVYKK